MNALLPILLALAGQSVDNSHPPAHWLQDRRVLSCSLERSAPDMLVLKLGPHHGRELALRRVANDAWAFLVIQIPGDSPQLMTSRQFAAASRVEVPAGFLGQAPDGSLVPILGSPGEYEVYVSDNLESEDGGYVCRFMYPGRRADR